MTLHSFGDSITAGYSATNLRGWATLTSEVLGFSLNNHAVPGHQIVDTAPLAYSVSIDKTSKSVWLPGFNDYRWWGDDPLGYDTFQRALPALMAWLAIPEFRKVRGQQAAGNGTWSRTTVYGGSLGQFSATKGSMLKFVVSGTVVYLAGIALQNPVGGILGVKIDGEPVGTWPCFGTAPHNSNIGYAPFLIRKTGLTDGPHTVEAVVESISGNVFVDWCAGNAGVQYADGPKVYVGGALRMTDYPSVQLPEFGHGSDDLARLYSGVIHQACIDLASDGLNTVYVDAPSYYDPFADSIPPDVHPNDQGHQHIADAFLAAMSGH